MKVLRSSISAHRINQRKSSGAFDKEEAAKWNNDLKSLLSRRNALNCDPAVELKNRSAGSGSDLTINISKATAMQRWNVQDGWTEAKLAIAF